MLLWIHLLFYSLSLIVSFVFANCAQNIQNVFHWLIEYCLMVTIFNDCFISAQVRNIHVYKHEHNGQFQVTAEKHFVESSMTSNKQYL